MFSILAIVSVLVLPGLLEGCCFPDKMSSTSYTAGDLNPTDFQVDFTINKFVIIHSSGDMKYTVGDMNTNLTYTRFQDGTCSYKTEFNPVGKCIPKTAQLLGVANLAGSIVKAYVMRFDNRRLTILVTPECHPVAYFDTVDDVTTTVIYTNVTTSVSDDISGLSMKMSDCEEETIID